MTAWRGAAVRRMVPTLALLACLLVVSALWIDGAHDAYFALLRLLGVPAFRFPFLDTDAILAVLECHRRGIDVYVVNPCDVLGRMHVYTPLWFRFEALPIDTSWTPVVGGALTLVFAISLLLLPPARDWRAAGLMCAAALSPAVAFAIERGNADLLMFVLAALAGWLAVRRLPTRLLAFPVVVLATMLKAYPATLLILALRERLALCLAIAAASLAALLAYAAIDAAGLREMLALVPVGTPFIYAFGAADLAVGLRTIFGLPPVALAIVQAVPLVAIVIFAASRLHLLRSAVGALSPAEAVYLMIGAVLILGCFVTGQSGEYRAVHLLFVLPALTALAGLPGPARRIATFTTWIILLQLWGDVASARLVELTAIARGDAAIASATLVLWLTRASSPGGGRSRCCWPCCWRSCWNCRASSCCGVGDKLSAARLPGRTLSNKGPWTPARRRRTVAQCIRSSTQPTDRQAVRGRLRAPGWSRGLACSLRSSWE